MIYAFVLGVRLGCSESSDSNALFALFSSSSVSLTL